MAEILRRRKALSISPLKVSQSVGAALACLGIRRAVAMLHGAQGCTAFGKVLLIQHFREPMPLQTTAMDQVSAIMGPQDNVVEGLKNLCERASPALIGIPATGLAETQGSDLTMAVKAFRSAYPQWQEVAVVPISAPDYCGCLESGYAAAVYAMLAVLVPARKGKAQASRRRQVNVLAGSSLTPGDLDLLKETIESFDLCPVVVPDLSESLDGHLAAVDYSPITTGGTPVEAFATLGSALATLVIGSSLEPAGTLLAKRTGVPMVWFPHLLGLAAFDHLLVTLAEIAGRPVPDQFSRERSRLQDAMLDTHFLLGGRRVAIAADPDLLHSLSCLLVDMGAEVVAAVAAADAPILRQVPTARVQIGDLEDLEHLAQEGRAELLLGNSHVLAMAKRLDLPLVRAGFPQYDWLGGHQRTWIGYRGTRQTLFDLANSLGHGRQEITPYHSPYAQKQGSADAHCPPPAAIPIPETAYGP